MLFLLDGDLALRCSTSCKQLVSPNIPLMNECRNLCGFCDITSEFAQNERLRSYIGTKMSIWIKVEKRPPRFLTTTGTYFWGNKKN